MHKSAFFDYNHTLFEFTQALKSRLGVRAYNGTENHVGYQVDAVAYLVDGVDRERFAESKKELDGLLQVRAAV